MQPAGQFGRHRLYQVTTSGYFDLVDTDVAFTGDKDQWYAAASAWLNSDLPAARQHPENILYSLCIPAGTPVPPIRISPVPVTANGITL